jgi:Domain of unknown function (DUF222)
VHPDGEFSDIDRARRRHLTIGKQEADSMSKISGLLDPEACATLDAIFAKWAAPGDVQSRRPGALCGRLTQRGTHPE